MSSPDAPPAPAAAAAAPSTYPRTPAQHTWLLFLGSVCAKAASNDLAALRSDWMRLPTLAARLQVPLASAERSVLEQRTPVFKEALIRDTLAAMTQPGGEFEAMGVVSYREPHFWAFSDSETIGTLHVQIREDTDEQRLLGRLVDLWKDSGVLVSNLSIQLEKDKFLATVEADIKANPRHTRSARFRARIDASPIRWLPRLVGIELNPGPCATCGLPIFHGQAAPASQQFCGCGQLGGLTAGSALHGISADLAAAAAASRQRQRDRELAAWGTHSAGEPTDAERADADAAATAAAWATPSIFPVFAAPAAEMSLPRDAFPQAYEADHNLIGAFGHWSFLCLVNTMSLGQFHFQNTREGCRWDGWLVEVPHGGVGLMVQRGIPVQIKTTFEESSQWHAYTDGSKSTSSNAWQKVPWTAYRGGLLVHIRLSRVVYDCLLWFATRQRPLPVLSGLHHFMNSYFLLPFSRPASGVRPGHMLEDARALGAFAVTLPPGVANNCYTKRRWLPRTSTKQGYWASPTTYWARWADDKCWRITQAEWSLADGVEALRTRLLDVLIEVCADRFEQFTRTTFVECEHICNVSYAAEHHGTTMLQTIITSRIGIGQLSIFQTGVGADVAIGRCTVEFKSVAVAVQNGTRMRVSLLGDVKPKDWTNLKSGRVRMLIAHELHTDPVADNSHLSIVAIPWQAFLESPEEAGERGYGNGTIDDEYPMFTGTSDSVTIADVEPFRLDMTDPGFPDTLRERLDMAAYGMRINSLRRMIHPNSTLVESSDYLYTFIGLNPVLDDLRRVDADGIAPAVATAHAYLTENIAEWGSVPAEWDHETDPEEKGDASGFVNSKQAHIDPKDFTRTGKSRGGRHSEYQCAKCGIEVLEAESCLDALAGPLTIFAGVPRAIESLSAVREARVPLPAALNGFAAPAAAFLFEESRRDATWSRPGLAVTLPPVCPSCGDCNTDAHRDARGTAVWEAFYTTQASKLRRNLTQLHPQLESAIRLHGYGNTLHSTVLTLLEIETLAVAILSGLNSPRQLASHARGSLEVGLGGAFLIELIERAFEEAWQDEGVYGEAREVLRTVIRAFKAKHDAGTAGSGSAPSSTQQQQQQLESERLDQYFADQVARSARMAKRGEQHPLFTAGQMLGRGDADAEREEQEEALENKSASAAAAKRQQQQAARSAPAAPAAASSAESAAAEPAEPSEEEIAHHLKAMLRARNLAAAQELADRKRLQAEGGSSASSAAPVTADDRWPIPPHILDPDGTGGMHLGMMGGGGGGGLGPPGSGSGTGAMGLSMSMGLGGSELQLGQMGMSGIGSEGMHMGGGMLRSRL